MSCYIQHTVFVQDDAEGREFVVDTRYAACEGDSRPRKALHFVEMCREASNPYGLMIWALPRDRENVEWLCSPEL